MPNTFCNIPYCLARYLGDGAVKERKTSKIYGGMFVTRLARSYGIMERGFGNMLTLIPTPPFSIMIYRRAMIIEEFGGGTFAIPHDDEEVVPEQPGRRVRPRQDQAHDDPPVISVDEEIPMDWYNEAISR